MASVNAVTLLLLLATVPDATAASLDKADSTGSPALRVERVTGLTAEEQESLGKVFNRFQARMTEFHQDTVEYIGRVQAERHRQITDSFSRSISENLSEENDLAMLARTKFEAFLKKYPDATYTPHVMFRLAELYFEDSENAWLEESRAYNKRERTLSAAELETLAPPPLKDYSKPLSLYRRIVDSFGDYERLDGVYYMLGYCYSEINAQQYEPEKGREAFSYLVDNFPQSDFTNDANMRLGEYYFENNATEQALVYYQRIVDNGEHARYYDNGMYKLAWSHYKLANQEHFDEYYKALDLFNDLLEYSHRLLLSTGEVSPMEPEAIQYMAISFADIADLKTESPIALVEDFFRDKEQSIFEPVIFKKLADVLTKQAEWEQAIAVYEYLQKRWPMDPDNPRFQYRIAQLYMNLPVKDPTSSARAQMELAYRYSDQSDWWLENRNNPDALAVATGYIEQSLAQVAMDYHIKAQETGRPEDFKLAAEKYGEYLRKFPFVGEYYEMEWYMADALMKANLLADAEKEYLQLLKSTNHQYRDGALYRLMQVRRQILVDKYGKVEARPPGAQLEKTQTTPFGATIKVYKLTYEHEAFIESADEIVATEFTDPAYTESRRRYLPALRYLPAQIYFEFGHFDKARERFTEIIEKFPESDEAAFSAGLLVRSFQEEGDLQKVRLYTGKFSRQVLGRSAEALAKVEQFQSLEEGAAFKLAYQFIENGKRAEAADAFLEFMKDFPNSEHAKDALFNAANSLEIIGQADKANDLFEQYINTYPSNERSKGLYFRIASNYASILELDKAITYYERLVANFPDAPDAPAALFNAAFLYIGLGENERAARDFEAYATNYPDQPDAEPAYFLAGERWKAVDSDKALSFYRKYLERYKGVNVDHSLEAQHEIIRILEEQGKERQAEREWDALTSMFSEFAEQGAIGPEGRRYAAEAEFRNVMEQYQAFKVIAYTGRQEKDVPLLLETKQKELKALEARCLDLIQRFKDAVFSSAAIYIQASAYFDYVTMLFDAPPPKTFDDEQKEFYSEQLREYAQPIEDKAKARAEANLEIARNEKFWTKWQDDTLSLLNEWYPSEFPAERMEKYYSTRILPHIDAGVSPITVPGLKQESPQEAGGEQ